MMTTQKQVREAFWQYWVDGNFRGMDVSPKKITDYSGQGKMYNTDTRTAFCDFVDMMQRRGELAEGLADRVTL